MIDKIEAMIERGTEFRGRLNDLKRVSPFDFLASNLRPSKFYKAVADLRPMGFDAMLHIEQKRYGTSKIELLETGRKGMAEIQDTVERIADCDPASLRLGRVDLAADVRDVGLGWFREHAYVQYKQFICAVAKPQEFEYTEMGKKVFQTLYFGKRPSCVRIYDKVAERLAHYRLLKRRALREAKKIWMERNERRLPADREPFGMPTFIGEQEWLAGQLPLVREPLGIQPDLLPDVSLPVQQDLGIPVVTRVENQFGGRVPELLQTLGQMRQNVLDFNPFERMKLVNGNVIPPGPFDTDESGNYRHRPLFYLASMHVREHWKDHGQEMWAILNRDHHGKKLLEQMREFLPCESDGSHGISAPELYDRYRDSTLRQLAA